VSGRRIVGNLFLESELARAFPPAEGLKPRSNPSRAALERAVSIGSLLRAFAEEGDRLWLPAPVDPARLPPGEGLPEVIYETGPLAKLPGCEEILAWGESPEVARARRATPGDEEALEREELGREEGRPAEGVPPAERGRSGERGEGAGSTAAGSQAAGGPLHEILWRLPKANPEVVARVHHRRFALEVAERLGYALPGARMVGSLGELEGHLRVCGGPAGSWVVKAPFSASGRDRYIERGDAGLGDTRALRRIEGLFAAHGPLLFEPWLERTDDFGACALLTRNSLRLLGVHRQRVDVRGQFAGIEIDAEDRAGLSPGEQERFLRTVEAVGDALLREGYVGPFGIDAWRYRDATGAVRFHPLGEINARLTFGFVARALAERLPAPIAALLLTGSAPRSPGAPFRTS
jgi:hypothetical protein